MRPRHRRRLYLNAPEYQGRRPIVIRAVLGVIVLLVVWYLISMIMSLFDGSIGTRASVGLSTRTDSVEVALQGEDWQRADSSIRLYADDAVATRGSSDAVLSFFDGSRMRLDQSTEVSIDKSHKRSEGDSVIALTLTRGRLWVRTPSQDTFSGAITRTINTEHATFSLPSNVSALVSSELLLVLSADGQGLTVTLHKDLQKDATVIVGEGQYIALNAENRARLQEGIDPYQLRDPTTLEQIRDQFLVTSLALLQQAEVEAAEEGSDETFSTEDLVVESPKNNMQMEGRTLEVSGSVSERVASLLIQGQDVSIGANGRFSVELNVADEEDFVVRIEAQDAQGVPLSVIERSVTNTWEPFVEPVRIISPVGSGGTFVTSLAEVEITGEAPPNTAQIVVNDYTLQLFQPNGRTWSYLASTNLGNMTLGDNVFTVYAVDEDGNRSGGSSITITVEPSSGTGASFEATQPPVRQNPPILPGSLSVTAPEAGTQTTTSENDVLIEGGTHPDTFSISVNGYTLALYEPGKTTWNYIASTELQTLKRGRNLYRIVSRNATGQILDILEYTITFSP